MRVWVIRAALMFVSWLAIGLAAMGYWLHWLRGQKSGRIVRLVP